MKEPSPESLQKAGMVIVEAAYDIFDQCGSPDDFCIQHCDGCDCIIFGGLNRLIYRPMQGFWPDRSYCSQRFLSNWDRLYGSTSNEKRD